MSHFYQVVGVGTPGPAGVSSGAEIVWWAGARFLRHLWASLSVEISEEEASTARFGFVGNL